MWLQATAGGVHKTFTDGCQVAWWVPASGAMISGGRGSLPTILSGWIKSVLDSPCSGSCRALNFPSKSAPREVCCAQDNPFLDSCCQDKHIVLNTYTRRVPGLLLEAEKS